MHRQIRDFKRYPGLTLVERTFNISTYTSAGKIDEYYCNQDELRFLVLQRFDLVKFGRDVAGQAGKPENLK
jgi:hypothetical protein